MTSKISFFNKGVFNNIVKRYWPAWALYAFTWLLAMPIQLLSNVRYTENVAASFVNHMKGVCGEVTVIMAFLSAVIVAMGVFSFMYKPRENSMVASLPVRREAVFGSAFLAGLLPLTVINLVVGGLALLTAAGHINAECVNAVVIWFGSYTLEFIAFYGAACCIAMLTGSLVALPILYAIFNFLAVGIEAVIRELVNIFVYGLNPANDLITEWLSPVIKMVDLTGPSFTNWEEFNFDTTGTVCPHMVFEGWGLIAIYALVGIILAVCALLLYRSRKMECTGDVIAVPALRPIFKYGVALCAAISFGLLIFLIFGSDYSGSARELGKLVGMIVSMAIGGAVGYFGADMMIKKSAHVFRDGWGGYAAVVAACAALCIICRFDVFGLGRYVPDAADIKSVKLSGSYTDVLVADENVINEVISLHKSITANLGDITKEANGLALYEGEAWDDYYRVRFEYTLENGRRVCREYDLNAKRPEGQQYVKLMESDLINSVRSDFYGAFTEDNILTSSISYALLNGEWYSVDLSPEQAIDLYKNGLAPDIKAGCINFGYITATEGGPEPPTVWIEYQRSDSEYDLIELAVQISGDCSNTNAWFKDHLGADFTKGVTEPIVNEALMESTEYVG